MKTLISRAILLVIGAAVVLPAAGYGAEANLLQRSIIVTGQGEVLAKPDEARMTAAVVTQARTAQQAAEANATAMSRVMSAISMLGIPPNRVQTSNYSLQPQYAAPSADNVTGQRSITGYQAVNQVTVTVDDLSRLGTVFDTLVRSGANQVGGITFNIADPKPMADRARAAAVTDATAKARTLASAAGVMLGPLLNIQEGPGEIRPVPFGVRALEAAPATPIAIGEEPIIVTVTMTFGIQ